MDNRGRASDGGWESHLPLRNVRSEYWTTKPPKGASIIGVRWKDSVKRLIAGQQVSKRDLEMISKGGLTRLGQEFLVRSQSYRNGGQPLRNTGHMMRSMGATAKFRSGKIVIGMKGPQYAMFQDQGFTTKGPNYIPLTRKGVRGHGTGNNPNKEGLTRGLDFMMAWKGVSVPARPFILPTSDDVIDLGKSIFRGLKRVLER